MTGAILWGVFAVVAGVPFVLLWWRVADRWADEEHRRFKGKQGGPGPTVVSRSDVEQPERPPQAQ